MTFKELLKNSGKTQQDLANELGLKQATISSYACGIAMPKSKDLEKVAKALSVSVEQLLNCFDK